MSAVAQAQEYLVKLGVQLDENNMNKLMNFMSSGKVQAAALSGALVAAGTAIYKFVQTTTKAEMEFIRLAKAQSKSVENIRAQQNALKAMNKTAQEVAKDPSLKAIYKDLQKMNKEMALPDLGKVIGTVRTLQGEFYKLRSTIQYGLQWINYFMLKQLQEPMQQIAEWFKKARTWLKVNMKSLSREIANYIGAFAKGLMGILTSVRTIFDWVNRLPASVKGIGAAVLGVFAIIKSGPLGQIMAVVEALGGLIQDYENFQWNKNNPKSPQTDIAFPSVWELLESDASNQEKASGVIDLVTGALTGAAEGVGSALSEWITGHESDFASVGTAITTVLGNVIKAGGKIGTALIDAIRIATKDTEFINSVTELFQTMFKTVFGGLNTVGSDLVEAVLQGLSGKTDEEWQTEFSGEDGNPVLGGIGAGLIAAIFGADLKGSFIVGLTSTFAKFTSEDATALVSEGTAPYNAMKDAGGKLWSALSNGLSTAIDVVGDVVQVIGTLLTGVTSEQWNEALGEDNVWISGFGTAIIGKMFGLNWGQSALAGLGGAITDAFAQNEGDPGKAFGQAWEDLKKIGSTIFKGISAGINGITEWWNGEDGQKFKEDLNGIVDEIDKALFGEKNDKDQRSGGLWDKVTEILGEIAEKIKGSELFKTITESIQGAIVDAFKNLWGMIEPYLSALWSNIWENIPGWLKEGIRLSTGYSGPGSATVTESQEHEDKYVVTGESGNSVEVDQSIVDAVRKHAGFLDVSSDGNLVARPFSNEGDTGLDGFYESLNKDLSNPDAPMFDGKMAVMHDYYDAIKAQYKTNPVKTSKEMQEKYPLTDIAGRNVGGTIVTPEPETVTEPTPEPESSQGSPGGRKRTIGGTAQTLLTTLQTDQEVLDYYRNYMGPKSFTLPEDASSNVKLAYDSAMTNLNAATSKQGIDNWSSFLSGLIGEIQSGRAIDENAMGASYAQTYNSTPKPGEIDVTGIAEALKDQNVVITPEVEQPVEIPVDKESIRNDISDAVEGAKIPSIEIKAKLKTGAGTSGNVYYRVMASQGARLTQATDLIAGEDGTEYVIPITKPGRAVQLLTQMFGEMGRGALNQVMEALGIGGDASTIGGNIANLGSFAGQSVNINYYNNVSAPVNITVQSNSGNAMETGNYIYNLAQRSLLRSVRGVLA